MNKVSNGWTDNPALQPRPFKPCPYCSRPLAGGEKACQVCAQAEKGVTLDTKIEPWELPSPRPDLEGGKK